MQKKLIALAVASLASGAALAQTNVTVYGIADAGYVYSSGGNGDLRFNPARNFDGNKTFSGIQSGLLSGSRLGFKGTEALGNGLSAIFTLEYSLNIDSNTGIGSTGGTNARQQFVGLQSDKLGTVAFGRQYAPGYMATINNDSLAGASFAPQAFLSTSGLNTISPGSLARWDNAMTYTSPNWSGFTAKAIYSFGEEAADKSQDNGGKWGLGGNYSNGPLNIDLVYQSRTNVVLPSTAAGFTVVPVLPATVPPTTMITGTLGTPTVYTGKDVNEGFIGGSYDFKVVKVMGTYQAQNDKTALNQDNDVWSLGAVVPVMAASNIHFSYAQINWDASNLNDQSSQSAALAWTTAMSKRTTLYAGYVWATADDRSRGAGPVTSTAAAGETNNTFLAGVRHSF